jgi:hypothetical protein
MQKAAYSTAPPSHIAPTICPNLLTKSPRSRSFAAAPRSAPALATAGAVPLSRGECRIPPANFDPVSHGSGDGGEWASDA